MRTLLLLLLLGLASETTSAQTSGRFSITRSVVAGGGATHGSNTHFGLSSTIGQPLGDAPASARFSVRSGFWIWRAPLMLAPTKVGSDFTFSFETELGKTYTPQYADSLVTLNWQSLPAISGDGTIKTATNPAAGVARRFFRLVEN
jgi:hypothetical protein